MADGAVITAERLRAILHYDPETGIWTWLIAASNNVKVGDVAGSKEKQGYWVIVIDYRRYKAHRLAWLYMTGEWPQRPCARPTSAVEGSIHGRTTRVESIHLYVS